MVTRDCPLTRKGLGSPVTEEIQDCICLRHSPPSGHSFPMPGHAPGIVLFGDIHWSDPATAATIPPFRCQFQDWLNGKQVKYLCCPCNGKQARIPRHATAMTRGKAEDQILRARIPA